MCASPFFVANDGRVDTNQLKLNSGEATNDLLPVQNDPAALGFRTNDDRRREKHHEGSRRLPSEPGRSSIVCHGPVDDPKGGWGLSIFSGKDQTEVERLTAADPIILDDDAGSKFTAQSMSPIGGLADVAWTRDKVCF